MVIFSEELDHTVVFLYCTNCIFYPITLTLSLNLPITGNILHFCIFKKKKS